MRRDELLKLFLMVKGMLVRRCASLRSELVILSNGLEDMVDKIGDLNVSNEQRLAFELRQENAGKDALELLKEKTKNGRQDGMAADQTLC